MQTARSLHRAEFSVTCISFFAFSSLIKAKKVDVEENERRIGRNTDGQQSEPGQVTDARVFVSWVQMLCAFVQEDETCFRSYEIMQA